MRGVTEKNRAVLRALPQMRSCSNKQAGGARARKLREKGREIGSGTSQFVTRIRAMGGGGDGPKSRRKRINRRLITDTLRRSYSAHWTILFLSKNMREKGGGHPTKRKGVVKAWGRVKKWVERKEKVGGEEQTLCNSPHITFLLGGHSRGKLKRLTNMPREGRRFGGGGGLKREAKEGHPG